MHVNSSVNNITNFYIWNIFANTVSFQFVQSGLKLESEGASLGSAVVRDPPANAGDVGSSPGPGRSHMLESK